MTLQPQKIYIRGTLLVGCDIKNVAGEDVKCSVNVDGTDIGTLDVGAVSHSIVEPGPHAVSVTLVGANTNLWAPASISKTVTMNGKFNFHYDENLRRIGPGKGFVPTRWTEQ